jgi:RNA polymerase sigma factor (sigma-70 family)
MAAVRVRHQQVGIRGAQGLIGKEGKTTMFRNHALEPQTMANPARRNQDHDTTRWQPLLSGDEECELAVRIKGGDQAARKQLILANLRLVARIARRYKASKLSLDDLVQEGNLGLIRASEDFDPSVHGCSFYTYAEIWIKAFIHRALIANDSLIRIPLHVFQRRKQYRRVMGMPGDVGMAGDGSAEAEAPSVEEIARKIGLSPRRLRTTNLAAYGLESPRPVDEEGEVIPLTEVVADGLLPDEEVADHEQRLLLEVALRRLNPVEAWIIRERYGLCLLIPDEMCWPHPYPRADCRDNPEDMPVPGPSPQDNRRAYFHRTYMDLARDCGLSRHRIQQVEEAALEKLRDVMRPCLVRAV